MKEQGYWAEEYGFLSWRICSELKDTGSWVEGLLSWKLQLMSLWIHVTERFLIWIRISELRKQNPSSAEGFWAGYRFLCCRIQDPQPKDTGSCAGYRFLCWRIQVPQLKDIGFLAEGYRFSAEGLRFLSCRLKVPELKDNRLYDLFLNLVNIYVASHALQLTH
jgi:hypothetical protein